MRAIIKDNKWIWIDNITNAEEDVLWAEFSVSSKNAYFDPMAMHWDGVFRKYNRHKQRLARPLLSMLRDVCERHDLPLSIVDERPAKKYIPMPVEFITPDFLPGITLEDYQVRAIRTACKVECGIFDIPTGGGKTEIMSGICKAIDCPTVILADQTIVIDQVKARLELREVAEEVGVFYAGKRPNGQTIVAGSIQSLQPPKAPIPPDPRHVGESDEAYDKRVKKWDTQYKAYQKRKKNSQILREYVKHADMIIVDECDKAASKSYKALFRNWFNGRRRYGFSGTPFDPAKPVENLVIQEHLGSTIARAYRLQLEKIGRIIPCEFWMIGFGLDGKISERSTYDIARSEYMFKNTEFHDLIYRVCRRFKNDGTLIIVDSVELGENLEKYICDMGIEAHFICGKTTKSKRDEYLRKFERREFKVLIGGKIINRGLDLKGGCENLIIATGGKLRSDFMQKIGRALRRNSMGHSRIFDFYFRCNKYLYSHSKERLRIMVNAGYRSTVLLPGGNIDGAALIKQKFYIHPKYFNSK